jgi:drug/metabolite transporter (DMT)-like permease
MTHAPATALDLPLRGTACIVAGVTILSIQDAVVKGLSADYPVFEIVFVRSLVAISLLVALAGFRGGLGSLGTRRPLLHLLRGSFMFASYTCYNLALAALSLPETVSLSYSAPLFMTALSVPLLGEVVGLRRWAAVVVGFLGVLVIMRPEADSLTPSTLLAVLAGLTYAISALLARRLGATDSAEAMAFSVTLIYIGASAAAGLAFGHGGITAADSPSIAFMLRGWSVPPAGDLGLMALCGVIAAIGIYLLGQAYRLAPAAAVAPFEYSSLPFAVLWGYLFWGTVPGAHLWLGIALLVGSGLYVLRRETIRDGKTVVGLVQPRV